MPDPRVAKLAQVLVNYSLDLKPGQQFVLRSSPLGQELVLAVYAEAIRAGAHVSTEISIPGAEEIFFRLASDEQLDYVSSVRKLITETFDASLFIESEYNTRELSGIDPARISRSRKASAGLSQTMMERAASGSFRWCITVYPTAAMAQEADMSLADYTDFVFGAGLLNEPDAVAAWKHEGKRQRELQAWLAPKDHCVLKGANIDLELSIKGRHFQEADGKYNFPDGEIFTGPVEDSANGWVRFRYPAIYGGQEVTDIELRFENGKVVKEKATKGQSLLTSLLDMDAGSRYLGEWGIGTNYGIQRFTKNMLFDEKIGGTIHLALGAGYPETGSKNVSGLHWDMLCDMAESEIIVDCELFYKNGKPVV